MTTTERAQAISEAACAFPFLGPTSANHLLDLLASELGNHEALDRFVPRGETFTRAVPPPVILHIVAGNTPAAGLQSIIRGLLLGSHNLVKLPTSGLPEIADFCHCLPESLAGTVECSTLLPDDWLARAEAVIVFGDDSTITHFHRQMRIDQVFVAHGHRVSLGVVFDDPNCASVDAAARDASVFDQLGCLSPHVYYVAGNAREYATHLAAAMERYAALHPPEPRPLSIANAIRAIREETRFRGASGEPCMVFQSEGTTAWTVILDETPGFPTSPLHRTIFVKPLPDDLAAELAPVSRHLSCIGIHPCTPENAARLSTAGASRICPIGQMQYPPWTWHQDGQPQLANLVRWVDFEQA